MLTNVNYIIFLPIQVHLPNCQQGKCQDSKVCRRESVYLQGSQGRLQEDKSEIYHFKGKGEGIFMGEEHKEFGGAGKGDWRQEKGEVNCCSVQASLSYMLLHEMHIQKMVAFAWSEDVGFGPLTSNDLPLCSYAGPLNGRWPSLVWTGQDSSHDLKKTNNHYYSNPYVRSVIHKRRLKESCNILSKLWDTFRVCNLQEQWRWAWQVRAYYKRRVLSCSLICCSVRQTQEFLLVTSFC